MENKPQFSLKQLYVPPFCSMRVYNPDGSYVWEKISNESYITGIDLLDHFLKNVQACHTDIKGFTESEGVSLKDFTSFILLLTGYSPTVFTRLYLLNRANDLLLYTSLNCAKIAALCGFGSRASFSEAYYSCYKTRPLKYRQTQQKYDDIDRYRLE